ncbi:MAG: hypothetical protein JRJ12_01855 [Deltaproteobacteria bacterium]|nr:hypothetical protein [Deltaproteobacteria bacterium]MBW2069888.1 hypothetical protein [Deltaproteobacteria bacterium]
MEVLEQLLNQLAYDEPVTALHLGGHLLAVQSRKVGLAANLCRLDKSTLAQVQQKLADFVGRSAREVASLVLDNDLLLAGLGMAALNSLLTAPLTGPRKVNAKDIIAAEAAGRDLVFVGHFPFVNSFRPLVRQMWVMEKNPLPGDLTEEEGYRVLGRADVVAMSGSCLINHTFTRIMSCCKPESFKIMLGPSTPLTSMLLDFGLQAVCGSLVEDGPGVMSQVAAGVPFRGLKGIRTLALTSNSGR